MEKYEKTEQETQSLTDELESCKANMKELQEKESKHDETKTELSDLTEKYEKTEQENQSLTDELESCKANMKELQEKGSTTSLLLPAQAIVIGLFLALLYWCFGALW
ncbi:unnamed protein product [Pleuronectes platessa]|uniref:Sarcolemma associated protein n=2 Tax=Pleuronectes platessa TaxID=8262 RepID=A0A9N7UBL7_PLEPL|nr:unnamed protein product [Pleuronectes platessa]